jgi:hypothetical protein
MDREQATGGAAKQSRLSMGRLPAGPLLRGRCHSHSLQERRARAAGGGGRRCPRRGTSRGQRCQLALRGACSSPARISGPTDFSPSTSLHRYGRSTFCRRRVGRLGQRPSRSFDPLPNRQDGLGGYAASARTATSSKRRSASTLEGGNLGGGEKAARSNAWASRVPLRGGFGIGPASSEPAS